MIIKVAQTCGFCTGVNRAIRLALKEKIKPVYILGELIHNQRVLDSFCKAGIKTVTIHQAKLLTEGTIIIRAHGVAPIIKSQLISTPLKVVDATCPNVLRIHSLVTKAYNEGLGIIIIGDAAHPEVEGINGCANSEAIIIDNADNIQLDKNKAYICVVQTTFNEKTYHNIINKLRNNIKLLVNYNTICYTTKVRQKEAETLSLQCDTMFVIGSKISSNTCKLYEICSRNCKNTYLIEDTADLNLVTNKNNIQKLGVTTGASTPKELVMEVIIGMSSEVESVKIEDLTQEVAAVDTTATEAPQTGKAEEKDKTSAVIEEKETSNTKSKTEEETKTAESEFKAVVENKVTNIAKAVDGEAKISSDTETTEDTKAAVDADNEIASIEKEAVTSKEKKDEVLEKESSKPKKTKKVRKISTMEDVLKASIFGLKEGKRVSCTVLKADETGIFVNFGGKKDGFIESDRASIADYDPNDYKEGDKFDAVVIENKTANKECILLDKKAVDEVAEIDKALLNENFELKIDKAVKGGLLGRKGSYTIFVPASQVDMKRVEDDELEKYVGKNLLVQKLPDKDESDRKRKRIVASHRAVLWAEKKAAREKADREWKEKREKEEQEKKNIFLANIDRFEVNNVVPGIVKRFTNFGAFVNVYGFDCLAPKGELSWERDIEPSSILEIGEEYEFVIIKVDPDNFKVSLSYKLLQEKPKSISEKIAENYHVGMVVKGTVQTLVDFGAFVSLEPRIDGLVHVSNISDKRINTPADVLTVGEEITAKIISIRDNRIALSIKDALRPDDSYDDEKPARTFDRKRVDNKSTDKRVRKGQPTELKVPKEEQENVASFGATESAKNTVLSDLLKGFEIKSDNE